MLSDSEFVLITKPVTLVKSSKDETSSQLSIKPAWVDDSDDTRLFLSQNPNKFNLSSNLKRKLDNECLEENGRIISVLPKHSRKEFVNSRDIPMKKLYNINRERLSSGPITAVDFNTNFKLFLSGSLDTTLALFKFDGLINTVIRDRVFEKFPITSAKFTSSGEQILLTGKKTYFKVYDLRIGEETRPAKLIGSGYKDILRRVIVHPSDNVAAFLANRGLVHLVDLRSYEKVATTRSSGTVESFCFARNGSLLNTFSDEGSVFVFDIRSVPRPIQQWHDFGCSGGSSIAVSDDCKYMACGSESGYVNLYTWEAVSSSDFPRPFKSIGNLTTAVDQLTFHPSGRLLLMASSLQKMAARILDLESYQVFSNFPARMGRLDSPTSLAVSPHGGYLSIGQNTGHAGLYNFLDFPQY